LDALLVDLDSLEPADIRSVRQVREWLGIPLIVLQSAASSADVTKLIDYGAEDVITSAASDEFAAVRIASIVRPLTTRHRLWNGRVRVGDNVIDLQKHVISGPQLDGRPLSLRELLLFRALLRAQGAVVDYSDLAATLGHTQRDASVTSVRRHVRKLREILEVNPARPHLLLNVRGIGYRMVIDDVVAP
jgi:DNA-binding response OmpR family regulator